MLNNAALWRLVQYCRRVPLTPPEYVEENGRGVRYVGAELRGVVWRDVEVRDVLLAAEDRAGWEALVGVLAARGADGQALNLLDLVTAMSLERAATAELTTESAWCRRAGPIRPVSAGPQASSLR